MRKNIVIALIALLPLFGISQSLFDKYEEEDAVTSVVVNQSMFNLLAKLDVEVNDPEAKDFVDIATSLKSLKVFTTEDKAIGADMKNNVDKYLKTASLTELMRIKDKDANVKFYIKFISSTVMTIKFFVE